MATIASLNVYLNAQTEGFSKGVESATRETVRFMMQLDQQARTLGMTADEAKLYNLEMRGVEKSLVDVARETLNTVNALKQQQSATAAAKALATELQLQAATFHMTADAAQIYRLEIQGADRAVIQAAKDHALFIQFLRQEKMALDAASAAAAKNAAATAASGAAAAGSGGAGVLGNLKGLGTLAKGGGILIGITLISDAVKKLGDGIAEAVHGAGTFGERMDGLARSLPVLGKVYEAMDSIGMAITGANVTLDLEKERSKVLDDQIKKVNELRDARIKAEKEHAKLINDTIKIGQEMTIQNDKARAEGMKKEAEERQKFVDERKKQIKEARDLAAKAEKEQIEINKRREAARLQIEEDGLRKRLAASEKFEQKLPKEMKFATATLATASNMGVGEAFRNAMSIDFGNDRAKALEKLNKEQLEIQRKIEENTRASRALSNANFN